MAQSAAPNLAEYSVSEIAGAVKRAIEDQFGLVRVRGELSGVKRHSSGHVYLALKDADAVLDGVMWRGTAQRLRFKPEDGLEVVATGRLTTYPGRSKYQLVIEAMEPAGAGALMALLEERRRKLAAEGLFDAARKRPLPWLPEVIGVVTSPTGAVIRDILHRLDDRFPRRVLVWPTAVQGEGAAEQVAAAIRGFNALVPDGDPPRPDVLIVARGGGSLEDLWAFNEEVVIRAAAESAIPLISAVGHETDTTLIDHASDRRAPTPTAAAEMAVPVRADLADDLAGLSTRAARATRRLLDERARAFEVWGPRLRDADALLAPASQRLDDAAERLPRALMGLVTSGAAALANAGAGLRPRAVERDIDARAQRLAEAGRRVAQAGERRLADLATSLAAKARMLDSLGYTQVLARGYAVVRADGRVVADARPMAGQALEIEFRNGRLAAVAAGAPAPAAGAAPAPARRRGAKETADGGAQGSLL
jgi:exodeoxyribonuclease VII large subunit